MVAGGLLAFVQLVWGFLYFENDEYLDLRKVAWRAWSFRRRAPGWQSGRERASERASTMRV